MRRLAHISDLHFGRHDDTVVEGLVASLAKHRPDLVVASGDFTQRAQHDEFEAARAFLDRIAAPKIVIAGNHDLPLYEFVQRMVRPLHRYEQHIAPAGLAGSAFIDDEIAVIGLNSTRRLTGKNGRISEEQMEGLARTFADLPSTTLKVLATHHPLGSPDGFPEVELAEDADTALQAAFVAGAQVLLSGHHHRAASGGLGPRAVKLGGILLVHAGTAVSNRMRGEANSYNLLTIDFPAIEIVVLQWSDEGVFAQVGRRSYDWIDGAWVDRPGRPRGPEQTVSS